MKRLWKILGILLGTALLLNVVTEILNRKSLWERFVFMIHAPMVFLLDTLLLLAPFLLVLLQAQSILAVVFLCIEVCCGDVQQCASGVRTTPFTAADLRLVKYAATRSDNLSDLMADSFLMAAAAVAAIPCVVL
ncbi:MAG: hypothetical protein ACLUD2_17985 [Clostridium sp.]